MIVCPVCDFRNLSANVRCLKCGALLQESGTELEKAVRNAAGKRGESWSIPVAGWFEWLGRRNPLRRIWVLPDNVRYRFPFSAGLLSLFPGLGQLYNRQRSKALLLGGLWWLWGGVCLITIREPVSNLFLLMLLLGWLLIWTDAVASAVRINGERWSLRNSVALWFAAVFASGVLISGSQFLGMNLISLVRLVDRVYEPELCFGDLILTNHMAYWFSSPGLGEVVYFDPERFMARSGGMPPAQVTINIRDAFQRVAGLPGDRIEKRDGQLLRNGRVVPRNQEPFGVSSIPDGTFFEVPSGRFWIPVTSIPEDFVAGVMGAPQPKLFEAGWRFEGWEEACFVKEGHIRGRAVAVVNPPGHRRWLGW